LDVDSQELVYEYSYVVGVIREYSELVVGEVYEYTDVASHELVSYVSAEEYVGVV
jgi:hypothetical protein